MVDEGKLAKLDNGVSVASLAAFLSAKEETPQGYEADKARKMKADADLAEIQAAKAAGELVLAKSVKRAWETAIEVAIAKLLGVGQKVAPVVILEKQPAPAAELITKAIRAACEEIHQIDIREAEAPQEPAAVAASDE